MTVGGWIDVWKSLGVCDELSCVFFVCLCEQRSSEEASFCLVCVLPAGGCKPLRSLVVFIFILKNIHIHMCSARRCTLYKL